MVTASPDWVTIGLGLAGGLALFLIGMDQMTDALKALAGHRLQRILSVLSGNRITGALTGTVTTAALQSSSVTTVLTVGFVSAELLTLTQAASVIIGANLGTTITAQIIALNVAELSLALLALGAVLWLFVGQRTWRQSGRALASLGLVFFGLQVMGEAMKPLATYQPVLDVLSGASSPWLAVLIGAAVTAVIQSSSATTGIVIAMAASGLIDLPLGIAIVLGANVGTCVTAVIAALGKGRNALRTAMIHVLVNLIGAAAWLLLLGLLVDIVQVLNPGDIASPRQLANAHTIFNAVNTVVFLTLLTPLVALVRRMIPDARPSVAPEALDLSETGTAALGLPAVQREIEHLGTEVDLFFHSGFQRCLGPIEQLHGIPGFTQASKDGIRARHRALIGYLRELSHSARDDVQSAELLGAVGQADEIAHLTDSLASAFQRIARRRMRARVDLDPNVIAQFRTLGDVVSQGFLGAVRRGSINLTEQQVLDAKEQISSTIAGRLVERSDVDQYLIESDLLEVCARVALGAERIAAMRTPAG